jgi:protein-L-isoaspartate(D-aspartate) O-methyltransferase
VLWTATAILSMGVALSCERPGEQAERPIDRAEERERMVRKQIEARGVTNARVLDAMRRVPRHRFVPERSADAAYHDRPLPIGHAQTISQPFIVATMTELVDPQPGDRILEIGTGSGYQAAVLAELVGQLYTIEIIPELADTAREALDAEGYTNVEVITGDGYRGLPEHAPFDGIVVTAAPAEVPPALVAQLAEDARLVIPVGRADQELLVLERTDGGVSQRSIYPVRFVPLVRDPETPR